MTTNHTELCEILRDESGIWRSSSTYEAAANLIESQAARIAELEKERDALKADAIERCAKVCDEWQRAYVLEHCCDLAQDNALKSVAAAIRALLPKGE